MRKIFTFLALILCVFLYSQTANEFKDISSFLGKTFIEFDKELNKRSVEKKVSFGIESRIYKDINYNMLIKELDDQKRIDEINFLSKEGVDNTEAWYEISKALNEDSSFRFVSSFINSDKNEINKKNISFDEMVKILRKNYLVEDLMYYIVFKKDNIYYQLNVFENQTLFRVDKEYKNQ